MSKSSPQCQIGDHSLCKVVSKSGIRCACECHLTEQERAEKHAAEAATFEANIRAGYIPTVGPGNADFARQFEHDTGVETIHDEDGRDEGFYDFVKDHVPAPEKQWGGRREGAGRKPQGTTYQEGYNAGYQAGSRLVRGSQSNEEAIARQLQERGIATFKDVMAAFERGDSQQLGIWLLENAQHSSSKKQKEDGDAEQYDY